VRYFRPDDLPPLAGQDLRALNRPPVHKVCGHGRMSHDDRRYIEKRRRLRDEAELAELLGNPVQAGPDGNTPAPVASACSDRLKCADA